MTARRGVPIKVAPLPDTRLPKPIVTWRLGWKKVCVPSTCLFDTGVQMSWRAFAPKHRQVLMSPPANSGPRGSLKAISLTDGTDKARDRGAGRPTSSKTVPVSTSDV